MKRSQNEQKISILFNLLSGSDRITHLIQVANIRYYIAKEHLEDLISKGLIKNSTWHYFLTSKGVECVKNVKNAYELLGVEITPPYLKNHIKKEGFKI